MSYIATTKEPLGQKVFEGLVKHGFVKKIYSLYQQYSTKNIRLDFCSSCQLKCPLCSTGQGNNRKGLIGSGRLTPENFRNFLKMNKKIEHIETSNWGEIFLNENLPELLKIASENKIELSAKNGVNFNTVSDEQLEALVTYKFKELMISIDGITQDVYETYRVNGNLEKVLTNIKKLNKIKLERNSVYPRLSMQFIDFPHNTHQKEEAKKLAQELGMKFKLKSNHSPNSTSFISKPVSNKPVSPVASREEFLKSVKTFYSLPCRQLFERPQINWDGTVLGCCVNKTHSFGNAFESSLSKIKTSEKYQYAMKMVTEGAPARDDMPCSGCKYYHMLKEK